MIQHLLLVHKLSNNLYIINNKYFLSKISLNLSKLCSIDFELNFIKISLSIKLLFLIVLKICFNNLND